MVLSNFSGARSNCGLCCPGRYIKFNISYDLLHRTQCISISLFVTVCLIVFKKSFLITEKIVFAVDCAAGEG